MTTPDSVVIQNGARRAYELATMLEQIGALQTLYTSSAWSHESRTARLIGALFPSKRGAIDRRTIRTVPPEKISANLLVDLVGVALRRLPICRERRFRIEDWILGAGVQFERADPTRLMINTSGNGGIGLLRKAKRAGLKVISDMVIDPRVIKIVREEEARWPTWCNGTTYADKDQSIHERHIQNLIEYSDVLMCPSEVVAEGVISFAKEAEQKVRLAPYALGDIEIVGGAPVEKRVLFVGQAGLRKGIVYLAEAARTLRNIDPQYEIRVAGGVVAQLDQKPECSDLTFLGHISRDELKRELATADVFCLPSLCEGMASASLEAMANGLPCIVTSQSGAPIVTDVSGKIVQSRSAPAIVEAVRTICEDRTHRADLSRGATTAADHHTIENVTRRLSAILSEARFSS